MGHADRQPVGREVEFIARLHEICGALPESRAERDGFGHTVFKVAKRSFVMIGGGYGNGSLSIKAQPAVQEILVARGPYVRTPYIGQHGWITLWGDAEIDWSEVRQLVCDAYRLAAPKRLVRQLEE